MEKHENEQQVIQESFDKLLNILAIHGSFQITKQDDLYDILLETEETGMVIGYHGETLEGLQLILSLIVAKKLGQFVRVSIEVGDYKKNRSAYLEKLAFDTKQKVLTENREYTLPFLKSWERRVVHLLLQADEDVVTESIGEGKDRVLSIKPKEK